MKWLGKGWTGYSGNGTSVTVNGARICNVDTKTVLLRLGLVQRDAQGCWHATQDG
jgi:hypothetical protein